MITTFYVHSPQTLASDLSRVRNVAHATMCCNVTDVSLRGIWADTDTAITGSGAHAEAQLPKTTLPAAGSLARSYARGHAEGPE